ncbi:MAG: GNAT family N-acetyltransferase [Odoribacter sp.]|nr:GNAT family N-acetyltransferase [Odoribacter sp.]
MIVLERIKSEKEEVFQWLAVLYAEAFPPEERRDMEQLKELLSTEPDMFFNAVKCDGELAGLLVYWDFGTFYYLEHLAVFAELRNRKIGQRILNWVNEHLKGVWVLEVEPDDTEMAKRRIGYYQRNGFRILDKSYLQPAYRPGGEAFPLWIMGNGTGQSQDDLNRQIQTIKNRVYYRQNNM